MFVEVRFRGLRLAEKARFQEAADGGFVEVEAPLPVGTPVVLVLAEGEKTARVTAVVEQEAGAKSPPGMRVVWEAIPAALADASDSGNMEAADGADATQDATPGAKKRRGRKKTMIGRP